MTILEHPSRRWLLATLRPEGRDGWIAILEVEPGGGLRVAGMVSTGGQRPRDCAVSPDGCLILAANLGSQTIGRIRFDPQDGSAELLGTTPQPASPFFVMTTP